MDGLVLLLRSRDDPDPYERALEAVGFDVLSVPVLAFDFVNRDALREALEHPKRYAGMIFTSPRAVEAVEEAMPWLPTENVLWHTKPIFAVGPRTADELRSLGFETAGEESGSGEALAAHIEKRGFELPLLFLCGNRRRDVLPDRLERAGVEIDEIVVYHTLARRRVEWPSGVAPDWVVFFSPSGVDAVRESRDVTLKDARLAAIGSTTAEALRAGGFQVDAVADAPSPNSLALAIRSAGRR